VPGIKRRGLAIPQLVHSSDAGRAAQQKATMGSSHGSQVADLASSARSSQSRHDGPKLLQSRPRIRYSRGIMDKLGWTALGILIAAFAVDQYLNYGYYTDNTLLVLRQIRHSFGW
jgi:hypothetical protein